MTHYIRKLILTAFILSLSSFVFSQNFKIDTLKIKEDLDEILLDISENFIYLQDKAIDLECLRSHYAETIPQLKTEEDVVLFFEYLLNEFSDSHLILNINRNSSYRLYAPVYFSLIDEKAIITQVWQSQIEGLEQNIVGAELLKINDKSINEVIDSFPTQCNDKNNLQVKEWIINKAVAGRYIEARRLSLRLANSEHFEIDLDQLKQKAESKMLSSRIEKGIGIIRINNTLGQNQLIEEFDKTLDQLMHTKGLILDLRNTVDGGNSYVARAIMGRFIEQEKAYQKHWTVESYDGMPKVERYWTEYVAPRLNSYKQPLVVLVGRWTGSMGEGMAIGFDAFGNVDVVGTEMERLAGEMNGFSFKHLSFGYRLSIAKLFHVDGTAREQFTPKHYIIVETNLEDETLNKAFEIIQNKL